jgi:alkylhydroperoxidase/carboxymuconolactone decarboxylase family protein YurZ
MPVADAGVWDPGGGGVEERLRVAARGAASGAVVVDVRLGRDGSGGLDPKTGALVRLAALVALDSSAACYQELVCAAVELGATEQEVIDTMIAVASTVGLARLVSASPRVALGLGYDVDAAFERLDPVDPRPVQSGAPAP